MQVLRGGGGGGGGGGGKWRVFTLLGALAVLTVVREAQGEGAQLPDYIQPSASPEQMKGAVEDLLKRLLPDRAEEFSITIAPRNESDYFRVVSSGVAGGGVQVWGSTGVTASQGLMYYLKYSCNCSVSWDGDQLQLPEVLPAADEEVELLERFRYTYNPCVFSYSMAFWGWERWERELDLMALLGVNLAITPTAEEALWRNVYTRLGLTAEELHDFFAGYAFLAWGRMGNIQGWGGPLSPAWHQHTLSLQRKVVDRMRQLGMLTVLPAFSGHVPRGLLRVFPDANVTKLSAWANFPENYTSVYFLDPSDSLFTNITTAYMAEVTSQLGTDHLYLSDPYNEMTPHSSDPGYLGGVSKTIFEAMEKGDSKAVWVTQGWMFFSASGFWQEPQARAYLTSVPLGRMLILDLAAGRSPQYSRLESFYGQPFIFCFLNNYGGVQGLYGNMDVLLKSLRQARTFPNTTMAGIGLTPEGINTNFVLYDLMTEMAWRKDLLNTTAWAGKYAARRYGSVDGRLAAAWGSLMDSVYNSSLQIDNNVREDVVMQRPQLLTKFSVGYSLSDFVKAWDLLIDVARQARRGGNNKDVTEEETFGHDIVDVTRQILQVVGGGMVVSIVSNYQNGSVTGVQLASQHLEQLISDLDELLGTSHSFLLGRWIEDAEKLASSDEERKRLVYNALNQITIWGPNGEILDYAVKQWAGLVRDYTFPRWQLFGASLVQALDAGRPLDMNKFVQEVFEQVEKPFTEQEHPNYSPLPIGYSVPTAIELHDRYRPLLHSKMGLA